MMAHMGLQEAGSHEEVSSRISCTEQRCTSDAIILHTATVSKWRQHSPSDMQRVAKHLKPLKSSHGVGKIICEERGTSKLTLHFARPRPHMGSRDPGYS